MELTALRTFIDSIYNPSQYYVKPVKFDYGFTGSAGKGDYYQVQDWFSEQQNGVQKRKFIGYLNLNYMAADCYIYNGELLVLHGQSASNAYNSIIEFDKITPSKVIYCQFIGYEITKR